ncbi:MULTISPECIES: hypothetical protein [unclassified Cupriavidus]|uniref:hypothetical protein n=1 Tax=unclassified Cupriavidus TaxID=2640874 RepID=UPI001F47162B|nr:MULTISPECIES: hypothetical protein [unclassified Cupriavidus]
MMMSTEDITRRLLLAMQTALLGRISPNIRAISCEFEGGDVKMKAVFDGPISDVDREMMDEVGTEVASHFEEASVEAECVRLDAPQTYRDCMLAWYVYLRKE